MLHSFLSLIQTTLLQIIGVLGIFFVFGIILGKLQEATQQIYQKRLGWKGVLWTAWIGTPIHEIGHIFFAKLFHHKIEHVSLFAPNKETGGLGHVEHSFDKKNLYQNIGNFFVGAAPMIFGGLVLTILLYFLVPNGKEIFAPLQVESGNTLPLLSSFKVTLLRLFHKNNISSWAFWLFLYTSFAIAAHMAPSKQDRKGMWYGLGWLCALLFLANTVARLIHTDLTPTILSASQFFGIFTAVYSYSLILMLLHYTVIKTIDLLLPGR